MIVARTAYSDEQLAQIKKRQHALGYKAGLEAAVKVCREIGEGSYDADACNECANTIESIPVVESIVGSSILEHTTQEPVAHHKDAPHTIYLQTGCDDPEDCECSFNEWGDTTWCTDQIHDTDIPYIRADYAAPVDAKAIRAEALEEAAKVCEKRIGGAVQNNEWWSGFKAAMKQCAAAIRGLK